MAAWCEDGECPGVGGSASPLPGPNTRLLTEPFEDAAGGPLVGVHVTGNAWIPTSAARASGGVQGPRSTEATDTKSRTLTSTRASGS